MRRFQEIIFNSINQKMQTLKRTLIENGWADLTPAQKELIQPIISNTSLTKDDKDYWVVRKLYNFTEEAILLTSEDYYNRLCSSVSFIHAVPNEVNK